MVRKISIVSSLFLLSAFIANAAVSVPAEVNPNGNGTPNTINEIFQSFALGNQSGFFPVIILVGLVTFLVGVIGFISAGDNEEKRAQGRSVMIFGIIVLFVMVSFWGFVKILTQTFFGKNPAMQDYLPPLK